MSIMVKPGFKEWVCNGICWCLLGFIGFTRVYWVVLGFIGLYWVLLELTSFYRFL